MPAGALGGLAGALLLLHTGEAVFRLVVPFLILFAAVLLAAQDRLRAFLLAALARRSLAGMGDRAGRTRFGLRRLLRRRPRRDLLAALAVVIDDSLTRINALKQAISLACNVTAAVWFLFSGRIDGWSPRSWRAARSPAACSAARSCRGSRHACCAG